MAITSIFINNILVYFFVVSWAWFQRQYRKYERPSNEVLRHLVVKNKIAKVLPVAGNKTSIASQGMFRSYHS